MSRLPERPKLEHDDKLYQRQGGKWLDGYVAVHLALSHRLDAKAKEDPTFWDHCQEQDREDDPKTRNRVYLKGVSLLADPIAEDPPTMAVQPVRGYQSSGLGRGAQHRHGLASQWSRNDVVELRSDIETGWRETHTAWCFRESAQVILLGDRSLTVAVEIQEDYWGQWRRRRGSVLSAREVPEGNIDSVYPKFDSSKAEHGEISLLLDESVFTLRIKLLDQARKLNRQLPWQRKGNHWAFRWSERGHYECPVRPAAEQFSISRPFQVQLNAVLHAAPRAPIDTVREYDTPFASAGLPSLGKRRP